MHTLAQNGLTSDFWTFPVFWLNISVNEGKGFYMGNYSSTSSDQLALSFSNKNYDLMVYATTVYWF